MKKVMIAAITVLGLPLMSFADPGITLEIDVFTPEAPHDPSVTTGADGTIIGCKGVNLCNFCF